MSIAHGHSRAGMAKYILKDDNVADLLYEVTSKGMPQSMTRLTHCQ